MPGLALKIFAYRQIWIDQPGCLTVADLAAVVALTDASGSLVFSDADMGSLILTEGSGSLAVADAAASLTVTTHVC